MGHLVTPEIRCDYYRHIHIDGDGIHEPRWRGVRVVKFPTDMILYAQVIQKRRPDVIVETGTRFGGSGLFFADMLQLSGGKECISIDIADPPAPIPVHPKLRLIKGSSVDLAVVAEVMARTKGLRVMVTLDSDHRREHVAKELELYAPIVTPGQYLVVEDCWTKRNHPYAPWAAARDFLKTHREYRRFNIEKQFIFAITRDGWLRRVR